MPSESLIEAVNSLSPEEQASVLQFIDQSEATELDLSPKLRQPVKSQNSLNGELTHGIVSTKVHA
jgi:hypothetical protein